MLTLLFLVRKLAPTQAATAHKRSSTGPGTATGGFSFQSPFGIRSWPGSSEWDPDLTSVLCPLSDLSLLLSGQGYKTLQRTRAFCHD